MVAIRSALRHSSSAATSGELSLKSLKPPRPGVRHVDPRRREQRLDLNGAAQVARRAGGACRSTRASRAARIAAASAGPCGRGPVIPASSRSAAALSTGSPSAESSAHRSSAVD